MSSSDAAKTVLITGATGTTGRAAVRESLALELNFRALVREFARAHADVLNGVSG